jgi:hypothetical protein
LTAKKRSKAQSSPDSKVASAKGHASIPAITLINPMPTAANTTPMTIQRIICGVMISFNGFIRDSASELRLRSGAQATFGSIGRWVATVHSEFPWNTEPQLGLRQ